MGSDYLLYLPLIIAGCAPYLILTVLGDRSHIGRASCSVISVVFCVRYIWWRWTYSMPSNQELWQQAWAWLFLLCETMSVFSSIMVYTIMSRTRSRSSVVDERSNSPMLLAPVDVFIATYNEGYDILERTIVGAMAIDHPDLRVWVLDDGARPWVRELATALGAHYTFRVNGRHAKAGNVNAGLARACSVGRRPQFMLLLDADFVANAKILRRTLPLFEESDVGIVQTPQHFFNPDPIQSNLMCSTAWPDEQRFFFNHLLASKDAWGAAFCCGTSAVLRVAALEACGGIATATVTEDMLTTFCMQECGYKTVFLNERLSLGLSPEGLQEYIKQRSRWCLGAMQQIYTRWSFMGRAPIGLISRISFFDGVMFWTFSFLFRILMVTAPLVFWWTGTSVINSTLDDTLYWIAPSFVSGIVFIGCLAGNTVFPIITDVTHLLSAFSIVRTVATSLVRPFGRPFRVTAKGISTNGITVQWAFMMPFLFLAVATAGGMLVNASAFSDVNGTDGYNINMVWSVINIGLLCTAASACVEPPKRRRDERFATQESATLIGAAASTPCTIHDISLSGASLAVEPGWDEYEQFGTIQMSGMPGPVPFQVVGKHEGLLGIQFRNNDEARHDLIRKLFTGAYDNEVPQIQVGKVIGGIVRKMFG